MSDTHNGLPGADTFGPARIIADMMVRLHDRNERCLAKAVGWHLRAEQYRKAADRQIAGCPLALKFQVLHDAAHLSAAAWTWAAEGRPDRQVMRAHRQAMWLRRGVAA